MNTAIYSFFTEEELISFILSNEELYKKIVNQRKDSKKQLIGEKIYEKVMSMFENDEKKWGKITGMLLESISFDELEKIIENESSLIKKIKEANEFYETHISSSSLPETTPDLSLDVSDISNISSDIQENQKITSETSKTSETEHKDNKTEEKKIIEDDDEDDEDDYPKHNWDNDDNTVCKSWLAESGDLSSSNGMVELYNYTSQHDNDEENDEENDEDIDINSEDDLVLDKIEKIEEKTEEKKEEVKVIEKVEKEKHDKKDDEKDDKKENEKEEDVNEKPKKVKKYYKKKDFEYTPEQLEAVRNFKFNLSDRMNQSAFYAVIKPFEGLRIPGGLLNFIFKQAGFTSSKNIPASVMYIYLLEKFIEEVVYIIEENSSFNVITFLEDNLFYDDENGAPAIRYHNFVNYMIKCPQFLEILNVSKFIEDVEERTEKFSSFYSYKKCREKMEKEKELKKKYKH